MEDHTWNKQTMFQYAKTKHDNKKHLQKSMAKTAFCKQTALYIAANNIK